MVKKENAEGKKLSRTTNLQKSTKTCSKQEILNFLKPKIKFLMKDNFLKKMKNIGIKYNICSSWKYFVRKSELTSKVNKKVTLM